MSGTDMNVDGSKSAQIIEKFDAILNQVGLYLAGSSRQPEMRPSS